MNYIKKIILAVLMLLVLVPKSVYASEFNFSVETVQPKSQVDKNKTYFDILVKPKESQELVIHMRNDTAKDVVISPKISSATTNLNGVVEYSPNKLKKDESLVYDLAKLVTTEKEIIIPKKGSYDLKLQVKAPDKAFDGIIAGGITLKETVQEKEVAPAKNGGLAIKNEFSYVVAIVMHSNEKKITPDLKLNKSYPDQVNARNVIMNTLQNSQPTYLNNLKIIAEVTKDGDPKPLYSFTKDDSMQVAPNSSFNFPIPLKGEKLQAGKYNVVITAFGEEDPQGEHISGKTAEGKDKRYKYKWPLSSKFEISKNQAVELNSKDVSIKRDYTLWYVIGGFLFIILGLLVIILLISKKNKKAEED